MKVSDCIFWLITTLIKNLFDWSLKIYVNSVLNTKVEKQQF